jgi:hypothetical protein
MLLFLLLPFLASIVHGNYIDQLTRRDGKFYMGSIGDSYAAGAAVKIDEFYDSMLNGCYRSTKSWEALMAADSSWTDSPIDFKFAACSGAQLIAARHPDDANKQATP